MQKEVQKMIGRNRKLLVALLMVAVTSVSCKRQPDLHSGCFSELLDTTWFRECVGGTYLLNETVSKGYQDLWSDGGLATQTRVMEISDLVSDRKQLPSGSLVPELADKVTNGLLGISGFNLMLKSDTGKLGEAGGTRVLVFSYDIPANPKSCCATKGTIRISLGLLKRRCVSCRLVVSEKIAAVSSRR